VMLALYGHFSGLGNECAFEYCFKDSKGPQGDLRTLAHPTTCSHVDDKAELKLLHAMHDCF